MPRRPPASKRWNDLLTRMAPGTPAPGSCRRFPAWGRIPGGGDGGSPSLQERPTGCGLLRLGAEDVSVGSHESTRSDYGRRRWDGVRAAGGEGSWMALRYDGRAGTTFERMGEANGKRRKSGIVAIARRRVIRCRAMLRDPTAWAPPAAA